ncbi:MAG TPA: hypothetical protein VIT43_07425 [Candidatus Dormibacteraeota bacterium]
MTIESFGFGCSAAIALAFVFFVLMAVVVSGVQYLPFAAAGLALAALLSGVAAGFWIAARRLRPGLNRWTWIVLASQVVSVPIGSILFNFASNQPDENPFADGGNGAIGLLGAVMAGCGALALVALLWESVAAIWRGAVRLDR